MAFSSTAKPAETGESEALPVGVTYSDYVVRGTGGKAMAEIDGSSVKELFGNQGLSPRSPGPPLYRSEKVVSEMDGEAVVR